MSEITDYLFFDGDYNFLWMFVIGILFVFSILFFIRASKYKKQNLNTAYQHQLGLGIFLLFYGFTRIFFMFSNFYSVYYSEDIDQFFITIRLAYCSGLFSLAFFFYGLEKFFLPTKGIIALISFTMGTLSIFLPYEVMRFVNYYSMPIYMIAIMSSYVYLASKSTGSIRKNAILSLLGLFLFFLGIFLDSKLFKETFTSLGVRWVAYLIPPPLALIGISIFHFGITRKIT